MHIAIEASLLLHERRGIGRYVRALLRAMPTVRSDVRYTMYARAPDVEALRAQLASDEEIASRAVVEPLDRLTSTQADVVWYPWNWITHPTASAPMVVSVMDLAPMLRFDHRWWKFIKRRRARGRSVRTMRMAARVLTISEFSASELTRLLGVPRDRMRVTLLAADDFTAAPRAESETLAKLGVTGPFVLAAGADEARKNLAVLFRAMTRLSGLGVDVPLVLCGPGKRLLRQARRHAAPWLRYAGYVSDAELATLYAKTAALVFPSRYEGFGLPVLEAMTAGAPVVCAKASSLPEVAGDAALYFYPDDDAGLADQLGHLLRDDSVGARLRAAGLEQARRFSWRRCAGDTLLGLEEGAAARSLQYNGAQRGRRAD